MEGQKEEKEEEEEEEKKSNFQKHRVKLVLKNHFFLSFYWNRFFQIWMKSINAWLIFFQVRLYVLAGSYYALPGRMELYVVYYKMLIFYFSSARTKNIITCQLD